MNKTLLCLAACSIIASGSALANPTSITFDSHADDVSNNETFTDSGFEFSANNYIGFWNNKNFTGAKNGTSSLIWGFSGQDLTIQRVGGGAFDLVSFDLGVSFFPENYTSATAALTLTYSSSNPTEHGSVTLGTSFNTFTQSNFIFSLSGLKSLTITSVNAGPSTYTALDNLVVTPLPVPEPETYALLTAGVALLGGILRRRARRNDT